MKRKYYLRALISIPAIFLLCILISRLSADDHNVDTEEGMSYLDAMNVYNVQSVEEKINSIRTGEISTLETESETVAQNESEDDSETTTETSTEKETESASETEKETEKTTQKETQTEPVKETEDEEQTPAPEPVDETVSYKEIFANSLFVGDSIMTGFDDFKIVNSGNVIAHVGSFLDHYLADNTPTIINYNPDTLILHFGLNEIGEAEHFLDEFVEVYTKDLQTLKEALPNTKIIVVALMPVKQEAIDREARFGRYGAYNERMKKMCDELGVCFYQNDDLFSSHFDMYSGDGVHFAKKLYLIWMEDFVKKMGLTK